MFLGEKVKKIFITILSFFLLLPSVFAIESCGNIGLCFNNIGCFLESTLQSTLGLISCIQPAFILVLLVGIASAILLGMKNVIH
jgi:hypothetical protein